MLEKGLCGTVITHIRGILKMVAEETLTLAVEPFDLEVLIPEHTRRQVQGKLGEPLALHTMFYIDGNAMTGRMVPRLVGFLSPVDREFFDTFCSVDGVGVRKALRAMVRPVRELARTIEDQDVKMLATYPGIGEAMAERIVAKLRRKVGKFALIIGPEAAAASGNGERESAGARRHSRYLCRATFGRPYRKPGASGHRSSDVGQEKVQDRGRYDRSDLSPEQGIVSSGRAAKWQQLASDVQR